MIHYNILSHNRSFSLYFNSHQTNPEYRLYDVNPSDFSVDDFTVYALDVESLNARGTPADSPVTYQKAYTAREAYDLEDLSPGSWASFAEKIPTVRCSQNFICFKNQLEICCLSLSQV